ncbi:g protein-coupled receptor [Anaeramoeba ignava]|uniref:G protein-coupled receptor n=1 Tax=Anaeramoeba ignava TaxID=1746090 RepID=A0A9Q0L6Z7_ANAIG|nr:g protein-coupled receptor [Anaeramoeba ignava]
MLTGQEIATIIGASIGLVGALFIIIIFIYFHELKIFYRKLIFILSVYDLIKSIIYLLPGQKNSVVCEIQYFLMTIIVTTTSYWSASISFISFLKVVKGLDDNYLNKLQKFLHLFMWIPVIVLIAIVSSFRDYDKSKTYWCISTTQAFIITFYAFLWFNSIACLVFYILTMKFLRKFMKLISSQFSSEEKNPMSQVWVQIRMSLIPLIQIIILIPGTIRRIRNMTNPNASEINSLNILHSLIACSQGFWDFWIFIVFDPEIRKKLKSCCSN